MTIDEFWNIVDRVHAASPGDMKAKCTLLAGELERLPPDEVKSFGGHFTDCFFRSYTHDIWGAAFVIGNGCGDDSFMDFRSTLISLGRKPFEAAMADADSLAEFEIDPGWAKYEGYQYVAGTVYKKMIGREPDCDCAQCRAPDSPKPKTHPREPAGTGWNEWEMSSRFPRLAAKYGFKDSDWMSSKIQADKADLKLRVSKQTADVLLRSGTIPACGLIPPFQIVRQVVQSGKSPNSAGFEYNWEPYTLEEGHYWSTVMLLERMPPAEKAIRPDLVNVKLRLDLECPGAENFDDWMESLKKRGLA
jgi:hypothetical protein